MLSSATKGRISEVTAITLLCREMKWDYYMNIEIVKDSVPIIVLVLLINCFLYVINRINYKNGLKHSNYPTLFSDVNLFLMLIKEEPTGKRKIRYISIISIFFLCVIFIFLVLLIKAYS